MNIQKFMSNLSGLFSVILMPLARFSIFLVYFWFGALKVVDASPASPLVQALFEKTIPFMDFGLFLILFGLFECLIGIMFLVKKFDTVAIPLFFFHMVTTTMPLFMVPGIWTSFLVPTLEGQYIVKNLLLVTAVVLIGSRIENNNNGQTA